MLFLLWKPLIVWIKEPSSGLRDIDPYVSDCQQIGHHFGLLCGNLLDSLDIAGPITKGIDDLNVLDVQDSIFGVAETFHIIPEALFMLLFDSLQGFSSGWMLVCALEVADEYGI
jgi:hypothetical protein